MGDNSILRPGTVFLAALALLVGFGIYDWSQSIFPKTGDSRTVSCSTAEVSFLERSSNSTHTSVFIESDSSRSWAVMFERENRSFTRIVDDPAPGTVREITAPLPEAGTVNVKLDGCSRVFRP